MLDGLLVARGPRPSVRVVAVPPSRTRVGGVIGCAPATPALAAPPDAWITTKSKVALLTTESISATTTRRCR